MIADTLCNHTDADLADALRRERRPTDEGTTWWACAAAGCEGAAHKGVYCERCVLHEINRRMAREAGGSNDDGDE